MGSVVRRRGRIMMARSRTRGGWGLAVVLGWRGFWGLGLTEEVEDDFAEYVEGEAEFDADVAAVLA